jgi:hypothetical protein
MWPEPVTIDTVAKPTAIRLRAGSAQVRFCWLDRVELGRTFVTEILFARRTREYVLALMSARPTAAAFKVFLVIADTFQVF